MRKDTGALVKVYVVMAHDYDGSFIDSIYSSLLAAQLRLDECLRRKKKRHAAFVDYDYELQTHVVDGGTEHK